MFRRLSLFHRIFLHGVLLIIALSVSVMLAFHFADSSPKGWLGPFRRASVILGKSLGNTGRSTPAFLKQLDTLSYVSDASVAVYTSEGALIGRAGSGSPEPLSPAEARALTSGTTALHHGFGRIYAPVRSRPPVYAAVLLHEQSDVLYRFLFGLVLGLLVIGAVSYPLARSIARPVAAMTEVARRLKTGDLKARIPLQEAGELGALAGTLNDMAAGLEARIRREKTLLANVSHELRTPLSRTRVALELAAEDGCSKERVQSLLEGIAADVKELEILLDNVLTSTRFEGAAAGEPILRKEPVSPSTLLDRAEKRFRDWADRPLTIEAAPDDDRSIHVDPELMLRVIANLLDNADKYATPETPVVLATFYTEDAFVLEVRDQGSGIPKDALDRIFEPFYRCDQSRSKDKPGVGLGLSLSRQIVEAHNGTITANVTPHGLTVRVELPKGEDSRL